MVLFILGIVAILAAPAIQRTTRVAQLQGVSTELTNLAQSVPALSKKRDRFLYLVINTKADGRRAVTIVGDTNGDGALGAGDNPENDAAGNPFEVVIPKDIVLSTADRTAVQNQFWFFNSGTNTYSLGYDFFGRTTDPSTGKQIAGTATLSLTHREMAPEVPGGVPNMKPVLNYQLNIAPLWTAVTKRVTKP